MVMNEKRKAFAARLNEALDDIQFPEKGYGRQQALADQMHVSQKGARKWLEGESLPEQFRIVDLAGWLRVSFEWLATGQGRKSRLVEVEPSITDRFASEAGRAEVRGDQRAVTAQAQAGANSIRDGALTEIRKLIDGQHRASCITDDDAILLHAALKAVRGKMEPSIRAAILLMLGSQSS